MSVNSTCFLVFAGHFHAMNTQKRQNIFISSCILNTILILTDNFSSHLSPKMILCIADRDHYRNLQLVKRKKNTNRDSQTQLLHLPHNSTLKVQRLQRLSEPEEQKVSLEIGSSIFDRKTAPMKSQQYWRLIYDQHNNPG